MEFYRDIFPLGSFERRGCFEDKKPNGIVTVISKDWKKGNSQSTIMFDDLEVINEIEGKEFVITNCIAYSGRNSTSKNGYSLYGIIIDLDYVTEHTLIDLVFQMQGGVLPMATYLVNSGTGIHVYYVFDEPIPLYDWVIEPLNKLKKGLTDKVWNQYTSTEKNKQYQNIFQGFRVVGSQTKLGAEYLVKAFKTGYKIDVNSLNEFVKDEFEFSYDEQRKNRLTLEAAKEKYPEWYQSKIVEKKARGTFVYNKGMYYKWIDYINSGAYDGNRYHCLCVLFANAVKCAISKENALEDAYKLLSSLNDMTKHKGNNFSVKDLLDASKYYNHKSHFLKANTIRYKTKIDLPVGKRNGRKQDIHIRYMNNQRVFKVDMGECTNGGRPSAEQQVKQWQELNPTGKKAECNRQTELDPKTIRKWWNV